METLKTAGGWDAWAILAELEQASFVVDLFRDLGSSAVRVCAQPARGRKMADPGILESKAQWQRSKSL